MRMKNEESFVRLRALEPEDLDLLYHIENDETLWSLGPTNVPYSRFFLHQFMADTTGDIFTDKQVRLVIEDSQGQVVGMADILSFDPKNQKAELGIVVLNEYRRRGYAQAALNHIHRYVRQTLHLHQVYAIVCAGNSVALRLFQQLGYHRSASLSDWLYDGTMYHDAIVMRKIL